MILPAFLGYIKNNTNLLRLSVQVYGWKPLNIAHADKSRTSIVACLGRVTIIVGPLARFYRRKGVRTLSMDWYNPFRFTIYT